MRKPLFWRDVSFAAAAGGLAALVAGIRLPMGEGLRAALFIGGSTVLLVAGVGALMAWTVARTEAALRRGAGVMGRWRVDAATWPAFFVLETRMAQTPGALENEFSLSKDSPPGDLEVIVGQEGVLLGDQVFRLPRRGLPEITVAGLRMEPGTPVCIELCLYHPPVHTRTGVMPARRSVLRFPVAPTAEREAARIVTYYHQGRPGEADFFHGRGDGSDAEDVSTCRSCGWQTHKFVSVCERCGGSMLSKRWARRFGGILFVLGLGLAVGLGYLIWILAPQLLHPGRSFGGQRFTGSPLMGLGVLAILGGVFAFGAATMVYGAWQMSTGRRNMRAVYAMVGTIGAVMLIALVMRAAQGA